MATTVPQRTLHSTHEVTNQAPPLLDYNAFDADPTLRDALEREGAAFDLIVLDPPYGQDLPARTLRRLAASPLLAADGIIAAEGHWRDDPGDIPGLTRIRDARYGETGLWFYAREGGETA